MVGLQAVVAACAKARDTHTCDSALVGSDDRVPLGNAPTAERRLVRYGWLRALLAKAQIKDESPAITQDKAQGKTAPDTGNPKPARPQKPTTGQLLQAAGTRLTEDIAQADNAATSPPAPGANHSHERDTMKQVLTGRDFRNLEAPTVRDSALEKLGDWLNRLFQSAARLGTAAAWVGRVMVYGFILAVCVGLALGLIQLERRWRIRLIPESDGPAAEAASARDWQLWLADARRAVTAGKWREAIHFVYWAAISRLESEHLWPADRARTPREYLALMAADDPRKPQLATLTRSFEYTWYGGRAAAESDYRKAETLANALINVFTAGTSAAPKGGAR